jgi:hypothetical protein
MDMKINQGLKNGGFGDTMGLIVIINIMYLIYETSRYRWRRFYWL